MAIEAGAFALEYPPFQGQFSIEEKLAYLREQPDLNLAVDNERNQAYLRFAYELVTSTAEEALGELSGSASALLQQAQPDAKPQSLKWVDLPIDEAAQYAAHLRELRVGRDIARLTKLQLSRGKFGQFRHTGDEQLISIVGGIAHEVGHAVLDGIGVQIAPNEGWEPWRATKAYLQNHPEKAISGNWITDFSTHEERAAVGFSNVVMDKVLGTLDYDDQQRAEYERIMTSQVMTGGKRGANQIDHLFKVGPGRALHEMVDANSGLTQQYKGLLGYAKGISGQELADMFAELADIKQSGVQFRERPSTWFKRVQAARQLGRFELGGMVYRLVTQRAERILDDHPAQSYTRDVSAGMFNPDHTLVFKPVAV